MVDTLPGEDRLGDRDTIRTIEARTDRFDTPRMEAVNDRYSRRCVHRLDMATSNRTAHKAQYAGIPRQVGGVAAPPLQ